MEIINLLQPPHKELITVTGTVAKQAQLSGDVGLIRSPVVIQKIYLAQKRYYASIVARVYVQLLFTETGSTAVPLTHNNS